MSRMLGGCSRPSAEDAVAGEPLSDGVELNGENAPKLPEDKVPAILEGVVYLDGEIASRVIVCGRLLVLGIDIGDGDNLGARGSNDVLVFRAGLLWRHVRDGREKTGSTGAGAAMWQSEISTQSRLAARHSPGPLHQPSIFGSSLAFLIALLGQSPLGDCPGKMPCRVHFASYVTSPHRLPAAPGLPVRSRLAHRRSCPSSSLSSLQRCSQSCVCSRRIDQQPLAAVPAFRSPLHGLAQSAPLIDVPAVFTTGCVLL